MLMKKKTIDLYNCQRYTDGIVKLPYKIVCLKFIKATENSPSSPDLVASTNTRPLSLLSNFGAKRF